MVTKTIDELCINTIGLSRFGASAPGKVIYEKLGLTAQHMADETLKLLQGRKA